MHGNKQVSYTIVFSRLMHTFKKGHEWIENSSNSDNDKNIHEVKLSIDKDAWLSFTQIAYIAGISRTILKNRLKVRRFTSRWIPYLLTSVTKRFHKNCPSTMHLQAIVKCQKSYIGFFYTRRNDVQISVSRGRSITSKYHSGVVLRKIEHTLMKFDYIHRFLTTWYLWLSSFLDKKNNKKTYCWSSLQEKRWTWVIFSDWKVYLRRTMLKHLKIWLIIWNFIFL
jgi:hypothetical protein